MDRMLGKGQSFPRRIVTKSAWRPASFPLAAFHVREHAVPAALVAALILGSLAWNVGVGLILRPPPLAGLLSGVPMVVIALICLRLRHVPRVAEAALYLGLWSSYPTCGTLLSYLEIGMGLPVRDHLFAAIDADLGFHWLAWEHFSHLHPVFLGLQGVAYLSFLWQPAFCVIVLAYWRPGRRNAEMLTAMLIGLLLTLFVAGLLPATGPATAGGEPPWFATFRAVHAQERGPFPYHGIVAFPSFHAVMAILFTYAHRGLRWTFAPMLALNLLLLSATPVWGNHYLTDLLGGAAVAVVAILLTRRLLPPPAAAVPEVTLTAAPYPAPARFDTFS